MFAGQRTGRGRSHSRRSPVGSPLVVCNECICSCDLKGDRVEATKGKEQGAHSKYTHTHTHRHKRTQTLYLVSLAAKHQQIALYVGVFTAVAATADNAVAAFGK